MVLWPLLNAHECSCSWHSDPKIIRDHEHSWGLMRAQECPWALMFTHECSWPHGAMLMSAHGWSWAFISIKSIIEHSWALTSGHEHSLSWSHSFTKLMSMHEHWWALHHGAMSTHGAMSIYDTILISAHDCSWVPMSDQWCSWVVLSAPECNPLWSSAWFSNKWKL